MKFIKINNGIYNLDKLKHIRFIGYHGYHEYEEFLEIFFDEKFNIDIKNMQKTGFFCEISKFIESEQLFLDIDLMIEKRIK